MIHHIKKLFVYSCVALLIVFIATACSRKHDLPSDTTSTEVPRVVSPPPQEVQIPKTVFWNDDEEFQVLLRYYSFYKSKKSNSGRTIATIAPNSDISEFIDKFGKHSDGLAKGTIQKDILKIALQEYETRMNACIDNHKNDFFAIGTYDDYYSSLNKCVINLEKINICKYTPKLSPIGEQLSLSLWDGDTSNKTSPYTIEGWQRDYLDLFKVKQYLEHVKEIDSYANDHPGDNAEVNNIINNAILVSITPEEMKKAYDVVDAIWGKKIQELFDKEQPNTEWGRNHPNLLRPRIVEFVQRQSILLVAKGNPFNMNIKECYIIVSGFVDSPIKRIK